LFAAKFFLLAWLINKKLLYCYPARKVFKLDDNKPTDNRYECVFPLLNANGITGIREMGTFLPTFADGGNFIILT